MGDWAGCSLGWLYSVHHSHAALLHICIDRTIPSIYLLHPAPPCKWKDRVPAGTAVCGRFFWDLLLQLKHQLILRLIVIQLHNHTRLGLVCALRLCLQDLIDSSQPYIQTIN